jgi:signal transduction histidine kinase
MVAALSRRLADASGPDEVLTALADAVRRALPASTVRVVLTSGGQELRSVTGGEATGEASDEKPHVIPLVFQGVDMGRMEVVAGAHPLDAVDRTLLADLTTGASAAVAAARRSSELQLAREQLVVAREQERRRIARDLHDGVGPVLSGLGFTLDALRASPGGYESDHVTAQARQQVREAGQLVRRLANQLRPPAVNRLGLLGALTELAARHSCPTLDVRLTTGELGNLSAATEVAAYAIGAEAITNVARHANASSCQITLTRAADTLTIAVEDDGIGLCGTTPGLGRTSMVERAEELGGTCRVTNGPGSGTRVEAFLPTRSP